MSLMDHEMIAALLPHGPDMCLLDELLAWDETKLRCVSRCFRERKNPLRGTNGGLGVACGIELAAQAMALHGRLIAGTQEERKGGGMLASVRDVRFGAASLDVGSGGMVIAVERLLGDAAGASYRFELSCGEIKMLGGRATVLLQVGG